MELKDLRPFSELLSPEVIASIKPEEVCRHFDFFGETISLRDNPDKSGRVVSLSKPISVVCDDSGELVGLFSDAVELKVDGDEIDMREDRETPFMSGDGLVVGFAISSAREGGKQKVYLALASCACPEERDLLL